MNVIKSVFVSRLAWLSIIISAFHIPPDLIFYGVAKMVYVKAKSKGLDVLAYMTRNTETELPTALTAMFQYMEEITFSALFVFIFLFYSSLALRKRKEWARKTFIVYMIMGLGVNLGFYYIFKQYLPEMESSGSEKIYEKLSYSKEEFLGIKQLMINGMLGFWSLVYAWVAFKLSSQKIREEFMVDNDKTESEIHTPGKISRIIKNMRQI